jgi:MinD superfamily P-loop ATPase
MKKELKIAISSGKGGTGKTFVATNLAYVLSKTGHNINYLDCDVEEPNGHLFLKPEVKEVKTINLMAPSEIDPEKCTNCRACIEACAFNAIAAVKDKMLIFKQLCHACGACKIACPHGAIIFKEREIGTLKTGRAYGLDISFGELKTGEGAMTPRLIKKVKENIDDKAINFIDTAPGTSCPVVEAVSETDLVVLVTDPTPFGINDLKLSVDMCRMVCHEPVILINRADYKNDDLKNYCQEAELKIIGEIPDERQIAELYSEGEIVSDKEAKYEKLFIEIAQNIIERAQKKVKPKAPANIQKGELKNKITAQAAQAEMPESNFKEIVVISGKGGTGKTTFTAALSSLAEKPLITDCDVDAADLHILLAPEEKEGYLFSGGQQAEIDPDRCISCGRCYDVCKFQAIKKETDSYYVDALNCEGCYACKLVCPSKAINLKEAINGELYISESRLGKMVHAKLYAAEENSGKLVSLIRQIARDKVADKSTLVSLNDGAPGTGCPVIASITGANYAVIVTEPTVSGVHDAVRVFELCTFFNIRAGLVINKSDLNTAKADELKTLAEKADVDFLGQIPYDKATTESQLLNKTIIEYDRSAPSSGAVIAIWQKIKEKIQA